MLRYQVIENSTGAATVHLDGELLLGQATEVQACLNSLARKFSEITVDLSRVRRIDSTGVGVLVGARSVADAHGARMRAVNITGAVRDVLLLVKLLTVLGGEEADVAA
jgi:anti-anti-sigma factor